MTTRRATSSYLRSLRSVFQIHNETVNIWSHIVGASVFLCAAVLLYLSAHPDHGNTHGKGGDDRAVYVYLGSVIACFVFSFV
jgi:adiponectin receptor